MLSRTVVDSYRHFDNLCGSHLRIQCELSSWWYQTLVIDLIARLSRDVIDCHVVGYEDIWYSPHLKRTLVRSSRHCATKRRSDQAIYEAQIRNASAYRRKEQQCRNGRATERIRIINQNHVVYSFAFRAVWLTDRVLGWLATERKRQLPRGKRADRTELDFRYPICCSAIGQACSLVCAHRRQLTFSFCY